MVACPDIGWPAAAADATPRPPPRPTLPRHLLAAGLLLGAAPALPAAALPKPFQDPQPAPAAAPADFDQEIWPLLDEYCVSCHGEEKQKAGLRIDLLDPDMASGPDAGTWKQALDLMRLGDMPRGKWRPEAEEREQLESWIEASLIQAARATGGDAGRRGTLRRLNKAQYSSSLQELLGVRMDFGRPLPEDPTSERGFRNDGAALEASALHLESYQSIARDALDQALLLGPRPETTRYRVRFGRGVGAGAVAGTTGGYQSVPLPTEHFRVEVLDESGQPRRPVDDAERVALEALQRRISVGLRGSASDRFHVVDEGLILYSALPHKEVAPGSWQGPSPNLKLELQRCFPERGELLMEVVASRGYLVRQRKELLVDLEAPEPRVHLRPRTEPASGAGAPDDGASRATAFGPWLQAGPVAATSGEAARDASLLDPSAPLDFAQPLADGTPWQPAAGADGEVQRYPGEVGVVFLAQQIDAPSARTAEISLGSDDALWVWLNGELLLARDVRRGVAPDQDQLELPLRRGRNQLLLKVVNYLGGFGSYHRLRYDGALAGPRPFHLEAPAEAVVLQAERSDQRRNLRFEGGALVPDAVPEPSEARLVLELPEGGYYQFDLVHPARPADAMGSVRFSVRDMRLDLRPVSSPEELDAGFAVTALGAGYLNAGRHELKLGGRFFTGFSHLVATPLEASHPLVARLEAEAEQQAQTETPALRVYAGTRTDDGMDYLSFDRSQAVEAELGAAGRYRFRGRLEDLPIPEPETGDTEILSGILVLGLWNDHLAKSRDQAGAPLLVESIEVTAPYHPEWPPASRRRILFDSPRRGDEEAYAGEVIGRFAGRAFRRPLAPEELERYLGFWRDIRGDGAGLEESLREVLVAVLCSPHFLFLLEAEQADFALASRLSYFLWDSPPDEELVALARDGQLLDQLAAQTDRMLDDPRARRFTRAFARQWLRMDRFTGMSLDADAFPAFTRFVKADMAEETERFVHEVLAADLPLHTLVDSDFAMLNQNLAEYYGVKGVRGTHFRAVPVRPEMQRGGLLSQGSFLAGHSNGLEPHPIKRAVWIKRKILGAPPVPPPPNVPDLDPGIPGFDQMTLKEQIEAHRDKPSCFDCHAGFDAYGFAFEAFDAGGILQSERKGRPVDASAVLPDGTAIDGLDDLKRWLREQAGDAVARSVIDHLYAYALGRELDWRDQAELSAIFDRARSQGFRARAVVHGVVQSPSFLLDAAASSRPGATRQ